MLPIRNLWLLLGVLYASTVMALPDLERGKLALARGDHATAEANLKPLAERGYLEAKIELAKLYAREDDPAQWRKAEALLREAMQREPTVRLALARVMLRDPETADPLEIRDLLDAAAAEGDPDVLKLQVRLYRNYPGTFRTDEAAEHVRELALSPLVDERDEAMSWYRAYAEEPGYAKELLQLCEKDLDQQPECLGDFARYFRVEGDEARLEQVVETSTRRYENGEISSEDLVDVVKVLSSEELAGAPQTRHAYSLLSVIAQPGADVRERMAKLLIDDPTLDPDRDAESLLEDAMAAGSMEASMVLGRRLMRDSNPDADPARAEKLLQQATPTVPAAHYFLGRFYERGYAGRMDAQRALHHYLAAARQGYERADLALARLYWKGRGVRVDAVNAYVFARLAHHHHFEEALPLLAEIVPAMNPGQRAEADALAEREFSARHATAQAVAVHQPIGEIQP